MAYWLTSNMKIIDVGWPWRSLIMWYCG